MVSWRTGHIAVTGTNMNARSERIDELTEELNSHLQLHIEDNLRSGMSAPEARRQALIRLGGVLQVIEQCRDVSSEAHPTALIRHAMSRARSIFARLRNTRRHRPRIGFRK
jgi:hypothetical protein